MQTDSNTIAVDSLTGDVWQGDAYELISKLPEHSIDLVLTSPPYWGLRTYGLERRDDVLAQWKLAADDSTSQVPPYSWFREAGGVLGCEDYPDWYISHLVEFFRLVRQTLKPSGSIWVNIGDTYFATWSSIRDSGRQGLKEGRVRRKTPAGGYLHDKQLLLIPARFAIAMQDDGWILRNDLIWAKTKVLPRPEKDRLRLSHEHWFHFVGRSPGRRPKYHYDLSATEKGSLDVVTCAVEKGTNGHTATFPTAFIRPRILSSSPEDGLVLDPFCGTGRAVSEAISLGRRALGFELSQQYAADAQCRVQMAIQL